MPFNDGIPRAQCFSLTDFHEFEYCPFRFFVKHHLEKKYELEKGSEQGALGNILDLSIKIFHNSKAYGQPADYIPYIVKRAVAEIREKVAQNSSKPSFYSASAPFINDQLISRASKIFQDYYQALGGRIKRSLGEVGFCEFIMEDGNGKWKLWGGPDAYEIGDDGVPEVVDYKYKKDIEKGRDLDMDLMPKIYILLASKFLQSKGYNRARFVVRFWMDPKNNDFYEEFSLEDAESMAGFFKQKIQKILSVKEVTFCERTFCTACSSDQRETFWKELTSLGFEQGKVLTGEFLSKAGQES